MLQWTDLKFAAKRKVDTMLMVNRDVFEEDGHLRRKTSLQHVNGCRTSSGPVWPWKQCRLEWNYAIAKLAFTPVLVASGGEEDFDLAMNCITARQFPSDLEFKTIAVQQNCLRHPSPHAVFLNFFSGMLSDEGIARFASSAWKKDHSFEEYLMLQVARR